MRAGVGQRSVAFVRTVDEYSHERRGFLASFGGQDLPMEVFTDGDIQLRQWQLSTLPRARRMSKSQQMRWDPRSAHLLLQVRVRLIDGQLRDDFARWYPGFPSNASTMSLAA